jgi:hypothetical protein
MPIGMESTAGRTEGAPATWWLTVDDAEVSGLWVIVYREFRLVEQ